MSRKTLSLLSALALAAAVLIPTAAFGGAHSAASHAVTLQNVRFRPGTLTINRGDTVTWNWHRLRGEHNVTFRGLHSRTGSSGSFAVRFTRAGTFAYVCTIHAAEGMRGKIIVR
ncbi:MAG TPA: plastocyanin/azurin family copper-binding protein [Solirubrobacteraceae bacterium]|nr:plastocyanin/azurin family copper-binding protein [Solirubrobacteraceae bacterium]